MEPNFETASDQDVVLIEDDTRLRGHSGITFRADVLANILYVPWKGDLLLHNSERWLVDGIRCSYLKVGASRWVKGRFKLKVVVQFCPDEPEPLAAQQTEGPIATDAVLSESPSTEPAHQTVSSEADSSETPMQPEESNMQIN